MIVLTCRIILQMALGVISPPKVNPLKRSIDVAFRCYPIDIDTFLHMNNGSYPRVAELARWRTHNLKGILDMYRKGLIFVIAEQSITYQRPIQPFQKYIISTQITRHQGDDKWLHLQHTLEQHPNDANPEGPAKTFATVHVKAVLKDRKGKTQPSQVMIDSCERWKDICQIIPSNSH